MSDKGDSGAKGPELRRELGVVPVFCIAAGAMISSGLFVLPGLVYLHTGPAASLAYLLAAFLVIPAMFCKAELATAMPKAGGTYFFVDRSLGPGFGTLAGIASWFSLSLKTAFALFGIGALCLLVEPDLSLWAVKAIAVTACLLLTWLNLGGVKHAGRLQTWLVAYLLLVLAVYALRGVSVVEASHYHDFMQRGWGNIAAATGMVFVSYGGLTKIASMAEEMRNPGRTLPLAMFTAFGVVSLLYFFVVLITVGLLGSELGGNLNPLVAGATRSMGRAGAVIVGLAAVLAYVTTGNAGIMSASRVPLAMSRDQLLPERLSVVDPRTAVPKRAIWLTSGFMVVAVLFLDLATLVKVASTMKILLFLFITVAVILMRESGFENYRPAFRVPMYPYVPILGALAYGWLLLKMGRLPLMLSGVFFGGGLLWYGFYGRIRVNRESALIRITKRLVPGSLSRDRLEDELRDILRARDGLVEDRFDRMVQQCPIIDVEGALESAPFLRMCAQTLSPRVGLPDAEVERLLAEREAESSTVLRPGLAIPHVIIPGTGQFHVMLVRSREGIRLGAQAEPVNVAFILAGTEDLRNYHLRVLMFIAQITQDADFDSRWMNAADTEALRNIVLMAKRTRQPVDHQGLT